jgi:hypothetical protein
MNAQLNSETVSVETASKPMDVPKVSNRLPSRYAYHAFPIQSAAQQLRSDTTLKAQHATLTGI